MKIEIFMINQKTFFIMSFAFQTETPYVPSASAMRSITLCCDILQKQKAIERASSGVES